MKTWMHILLHPVNPVHSVWIAFLCILSPASAAEPTPRERGDLAIHARAILRKYCAGCHQDEKTFDALSYSQITSEKPPAPFVNLKEPPKSLILEYITDGSMPPGGKPRPSDSEIAVLRKWLAAKAPAYPKDFDDASTLQTIHSDWSQQKDPKHVRYVSFAPKLRDDPSLTGLLQSETALLKALEASARAKSVQLVPLDEAATTYRIDIEKLGWAKADQFARGPGVEDVYEGMIAFDLLLLENPFAIRDARFEKLLGSPKHVYPAAYLRGDWLAQVLAPGSPLAADMKSMVELADAKDALCGPPLRGFEKPKTTIPGGTTPLTAWYGPERINPFKLDFTINGNTNPTSLLNEPLNLRATADQDAKFVLINVISGGEPRLQPVAMGEVLIKNTARDLKTTGGKSITISGIDGGRDAGTEHFILVAAPGGVPAPVIVRSTHRDGCEKEGRSPVWRVIFEDFDGTKAARQVVSVNVKRK
jgi:mono/diheme cytochrome c family protein